MGKQIILNHKEQEKKYVELLKQKKVAAIQFPVKIIKHRVTNTFFIYIRK